MKSIKSFDGTKISYVRYKGGDVLVFLHGLGCNHTFLKHEIEYFRKKKYGIVAFDLRGHGSSERPNKEYKLEYFAKDLKKVLDHLQLQEFFLLLFRLPSYVCKEYMI